MSKIRIVSIIAIVAIILIGRYFLEKRQNKSYHYFKITYSIYDDEDQIIWDTLVYQKGEVKLSKKGHDGYWGFLWLLDYDGEDYYEILYAPEKTEEEVDLSVIDEYGYSFAVRISETEKYIVLIQSESDDGEFLFMKVYLD